MSKITIIGAGKTGREFIGRLAAEKNAEITFIDKDENLVNELNSKESFTVSFLAVSVKI